MAPSKDGNVSDTPQADSRLSSQDDAETLIRFQGAILEEVALGSDEGEICNQICRLGEGMVPGSIATIMLLDEKGCSMSMPPPVRLRKLLPVSTAYAPALNPVTAAMPSIDRNPSTRKTRAAIRDGKG